MLIVEVTRGPVVESTHVVRACATDADGNVIGEAAPGDGDWETFMRSAAKPFQASLAASAGVIERFGLTQRHLAVGCASHDGSAMPVALVHEILAAAGLPDDAVVAGDDGQGGGLHHQCSGNHALALALCVLEGWPTDSYLDPEHPVQAAMLKTVFSACGTRPELEPDGCGMTAYRVPLSGFARAYARLGIGWSLLPGLDVVAAAMRAHPYVVREAGQADAELMAASSRLVAKHGAEGAIGVGTDAGVGVAVRVVDGASRAWGTAGVAAVRRWLDPDLAGPAIDLLERPPMLDGAHRPIGVMQARWVAD